MLKGYYENLKGSWGKNTVFLDEVDSTNKYMLDGDFKPGDVVVASRQTSGRGRSGRTWSSVEADSLLFTVQLPVMSTDKLMGAQIVAGYGICRALMVYADVRMKWPNDLVISGKKLAGMLIETRFMGNELRKVIIGAGVNISKVPDGLRASSRALFAGEQPVSEGILLAGIISSLEECYDEYLSGEMRIEEEWQHYSANYMKGIRFHRDNEVCSAIEAGIDSAGRLLIKNDDGLQAVSEGEVGYDFRF